MDSQLRSHSPSSSRSSMRLDGDGAALVPDTFPALSSLRVFGLGGNAARIAAASSIWASCSWIWDLQRGHHGSPQTGVTSGGDGRDWSGSSGSYSASALRYSASALRYRELHGPLQA